MEDGDLSPRERRFLSDVHAAVGDAERALNDPTVLAAGVALQEQILLERELEVETRKLEVVSREFEVVSLFTPPHEVSSYMALGVNLGRSLEDMLAVIRYVERTLQWVLSYRPVPPPLLPIERDARKAWKCFPEDPEPLDFFIRERLGVKRHAKGPLPDPLRHEVWALLDRCFAPLPLYRSGELFLLRARETEGLADLLNGHLNLSEHPSVERTYLDQDMTAEEVRSELVPALIFDAWKSLHPTLTFDAWKNGHRDKLSPTLLNSVSNRFRKEGGEKNRLEVEGNLEKKKRLEGDSSREYMEPVEPDDLPGTNAALDRLMLLEELRSRLTEREYQVIYLRSERFTYSEIAAQLGITEGTVKTLAFRARPVIREVIGA